MGQPATFWPCGLGDCDRNTISREDALEHTLLPPRAASHNVLRRNGHAAQPMEQRSFQILLHSSLRPSPAPPARFGAGSAASAPPPAPSRTRPGSERCLSLQRRYPGSWDAAHRWGEVGAPHPSRAPASVAGRSDGVTEPELRQLISSAEAKLHHQRPEHLVRGVQVDEAGASSPRPAAASQAPGEPGSGGPESARVVVLDVELLQAPAGQEVGTRLGGPQRRGAGGAPTAGTSSAPKK